MKDIEKLDKDYVLHTYARNYVNFKKGVNATLYDDENKDYLEDLVKINYEAKIISTELIEVCKNLYNERAGDDTTVCAITLKEKTYTSLFIGPPKKMIIFSSKNLKKVRVIKLFLEELQQI